MADWETNLETESVAADAQSASHRNKIHAVGQQSRQLLHRWPDHPLGFASGQKLKASNLNSSAKYTYSKIYRGSVRRLFAVVQPDHQQPTSIRS